MSTINHALRASILETLGKDRMTLKQITRLLDHQVNWSVRATLLKMRKEGLVRCASRADEDNATRWWAK